MTLYIEHVRQLSSEDIGHIGPVARVYADQNALTRASEQRDWVIERVEREMWDNTRPGDQPDLSLAPSHPDVLLEDIKVAQARESVVKGQAEIGGVAFLPPTEALPKIEKKLTALNKRTERAGTTPTALTITKETVVLNYCYAEDRVDHRGFHADFEHTFIVVVPARPLIPGFHFLATIQHTEHGNLIRKIPVVSAQSKGLIASGPEVEAQAALDAIDLTTYRTSDATCYNCGLDRDRKDTYLVYNDTDGTIKQVGRTCLRDYTGVDNAEKAVKSLEQYWEFERMFSGKGETVRIPTRDFLAHCSLAIRNQGGYKNAQSGYSTREWATSNFFDKLRERKDKDGPCWIDPEQTDFDRADVTLAWTREWDESSDFAHSVKVAVAGHFIPERAEGFAAASFVAREKWLARAEERAAKQAEQEARAEKGFVGTIGQREVFTLTLRRVRWIEDRYSYDANNKPVYIFSDAEGNEITWSASGDRGLTEEATYEVKATVKDHRDDDRYGKSTIITRAKIEKEIANA